MICRDVACNVSLAIVRKCIVRKCLQQDVASYVSTISRFSSLARNNAGEETSMYRVPLKKKVAMFYADVADSPLHPSQRLTHLNLGAYHLRLALLPGTPPRGRPRSLMCQFFED